MIEEDCSDKKVWQIVGEPEADARQGKISVDSPIAWALIGKRKGAVVEVDALGGAKSCKPARVGNALKQEFAPALSQRLLPTL